MLSIKDTQKINVLSSCCSDFATLNNKIKNEIK